MLKNLGDKFKKQGWGWLWTEGAAQLKLEDALNVGGFGYPALSVVSAKKMKYSILTGTYIRIFNHFLKHFASIAKQSLQFYWYFSTSNPKFWKTCTKTKVGQG